jgi:hypothetical protein
MFLALLELPMLLLGGMGLCTLEYIYVCVSPRKTITQHNFQWPLFPLKNQNTFFTYIN